MSDWRLKFGKVVPTVWANGSEFYEILPDGAEMYTVNLHVRRIVEQDLAAARETRRDAAELLESWNVDCVLAGGGPVSTLEGVQAEQEFIKEIQKELTVPFTTSIQAQIDVLNELEIESLLMVSPFIPERDEETKLYLEENDFNVVATGGISESNVSKISEMPATTSYRQACKLAATVDETFDLIYIPCAAWRGAEHIAALESDTGKPVLTSTQAQIWSACRMAGVKPDIEGYGEIFDIL